MSQNLNNIATLPFLGTPFGQPIGLCAPRPASTPPRAVRIDIDWAQYGASSLNQRIGVSVNLLGQGSTQIALDYIRSVYIDNTFSNVPVYVQFPDTLFTVVCPPGAVVMSPVATYLQQATIYAEGFTDAALPKCSVHFMNVEKDGYYLPTDFSIQAEVLALANGNSGLVAATPTFNSSLLDTGPLFNDRVLAFVVGYAGQGVNPAIASAVFGGLPLTIAVDTNSTSGTGGSGSAVLYMANNALLSGVLTVNFSANVRFTGFQFYSIRNIDSPIPVVSNFNGASPTSLTMTFVNGAAGIFGSTNGGSTNVSELWTGATSDYAAGASFGGGDLRGFGAANYEALNDEIRLITCATVGGGVNRMCGAVWT